MSIYVGKDGRPISRAQALAAFEDDAQRIVRQDTEHGHFVSTVWLVIDHGHGGTPIPFETMIFTRHEGDCTLDATYQERYATESAALAGHERALLAARTAPCGGAS